MKGAPTGFWGKLRGSGSELEWHPLADHCADVAGCAEVLIRETALGARIATLACVELGSELETSRSAVHPALRVVGRLCREFLGSWKSFDRMLATRGVPA